MTGETPPDLTATHERATVAGKEVAIIALSGDFDLTSVEVFEGAVTVALDGGADALVLDTSGLRFVDSAGIHALTRARRSSTTDDLQLGFVVAPGSAVERVLELSGLMELLRPGPDREAALASLGDRGDAPGQP